LIGADVRLECDRHRTDRLAAKHELSHELEVYQRILETIRQALEQKDLLTKSRRLLEVFRRQASVIDRLEEEQPGISRLRRDVHGNLLIDDDIPNDREAFLAELQNEIDRAQALLQKRT